MKLPEIKRLAARYRPIEESGLTLYPVTVENFEAFLVARPAIEVLHQSLPVALLRIPLLSALYRMDFEASMKGEAQTGLFARTLLALALSLRLGEGQEPDERVAKFRLATDPEDPGTLRCLRFEDDSGEEKEITPAQYKKLREIIAIQNGVELESDEANPAIVQAQKDMAAASGTSDLDPDPQALITAVAALSRTDESEVYDWPIRKLQAWAGAYERFAAYLVCGIGAASGATWKDGNPVPHPFFRRNTTSLGFTSMDLSERPNGENAPDGVWSIVQMAQNQGG